jgi:uncharacterized SAM-binding protein YcdF (DUF218 family)
MSPLELLKHIGGPGSIGFVALASILAILVIRLSPRHRVLARAWLLAVYAAYIILSIPVVAQGIARPFLISDAGQQAVSTGMDTLVVFDGDNRVGRLDEAVRLWQQRRPRVVVVSGEQWLIGRLVERGIPPQVLVRESSSANTREQIEYVKQYMHDHASDRVAIVVSRLQRPRTAALVRRAQLRIMLFGAPVDKEPATRGWRRFVPAYAALRVSRDALYERVAIYYYRSRGWIDTPEAVMASAR